jgi:excisionase family DNA binding protein
VIQTGLPPLAVRRREAARLLGVGLSKIDELVATAQLRAVKSGKCLLIIYSSLQAYAEALPEAKLQLPSHIRRKLDADASVPKPIKRAKLKR